MLNKEKIIILLLIFNLILGASAFGISFYLIKLSGGGRLSLIKAADNGKAVEADTATPAIQLPKENEILRLDEKAGELASSFALAYGNASLKELNPKMTEEMKKREAQKEKMISQSKNPAVQYTTTEILSQQVISQNDSAGKYLLMFTVERQEVKAGEKGGRIFNQDLLMTLVRTGSEWKVDNAEWQKESQ